jgi:NAD+ synthase (glutamine-hydrolysing)
VRLAICIPSVRLGNPSENAERTISLSQRAADQHAAVVVFPELGLSGYSNEDLFHQDALLDGSVAALGKVVDASRALAPLLIVGAPLLVEEKLFNCAVAIHRGAILGATPKTYLPNYRELYERRQFTSGTNALTQEFTLLSTRIPFGNDILYDFTSIRGCRVHTEICEDFYVLIPPSSFAALAGATVLVNLSASNITIGKADYRRLFETSQFKRSALPNAPKVGSGGSLSPRSDWPSPSDSHADAWLQELEREVSDA